VEEVRFAADSPVEGDGFEPSVPLSSQTYGERYRPGLTDKKPGKGKGMRNEALLLRVESV